MDALHPDLQSLLRQQDWSQLTDAQTAAQAPILNGKHVLLVAPTGHGKTEAALLPILSRLLVARDELDGQGKPWPPGFKVLYITPLRALNRDLLGRLESWGEHLGITIGVRHGDTTQYERSKQSRNPPDVLITTPETTQLLLYGDTLRRHLRTVRFVVLDEIHDLCQSERGAQLAVALERIEEVIAQPEPMSWLVAKERECPAEASALGGSGFQRVGLSATVAEPVPVAAWMGGPNRVVQIVKVETNKKIDLVVAAPVVKDTTPDQAAALSISPAMMAELATIQQLVASHAKVLVFHNTRHGAETLTSRASVLDDGAANIGLHHGSLSPEHRRDVEQQFKVGDLKALAATSSLELGIDVGVIDHVIQVHSPRSVARMLQRLGRAGHRIGAVSEGTMIPAGPEDALECLAIAQMAREGHLEPLEIRPTPLVVLANQLVALCNEYQRLNREWAWSVITRSGSFADLDEGLFEATWDVLLELKTVYADEDKPRTMSRSGRARKHFLSHIGLIPDSRTYRVFDEASKRTIGAVDDAFVAAGLHPGASFVMAGRNWRVLEIDVESRRVRVAAAKELGPVPDWTGSQLPVSYDVAQEVVRLRAAIAGGHTFTPGNEEAALWAATPIHAHADAGLQIPTDRLVTIERGRDGVTVNVALGTKGNEALGRITQALMHQRHGRHVGMQSDAYRIHLRLPPDARPQELDRLWEKVELDSLDLLVAMVVRDSPILKHHLVHVSKHFGALPDDLDPNRFSQRKLDQLLAHPALHEETISRLLHDRLDLAAVHAFLEGLQAGSIEVVHQGMGPLSRLGQDDAKRALLAPLTNDALVAATRTRIEGSDLLLLCTQCRHHWQSQVGLLRPRLHCRSCQSNQVACLRPWHTEARAALGRGGDPKERKRLERNAQLVANFPAAACRALAARGVGPTTAARILQKTSDIELPLFWQEILRAELEFARTSAFWNSA